MMDRAAVEATLREAYAARVRGDVEETVRYFTDDAVFALAVPGRRARFRSGARIARPCVP
jgi:ketosteroid isomerase-like protein